MKQRLLVCKNCGEVFTVPNKPKYNGCKYCSKICRKEAKEEQDRKAREKYNKTWKEHIIHGKAFLGNSNLKSKPKAHFEDEYEAIKKEINRLNLKHRNRYAGGEK